MACAAFAGLLRPACAANTAAEQDSAATNATASLISRLVERGALTPNDSRDLLLMAEADAAEARAQKALLEAAIARNKALEAMLQYRRSSVDAGPPARINVTHASPPPVAESDEPAPEPAVVRRTSRSPSSALVAAVKVSRPVRAEPTAPAREEPPAAEPAPEPEAPARPRVTSSAPAPSPASEAPEAPLPGDVVRVTYVPEVVKSQLREEIKQEVLAQAREEKWATPNTFPEWVSLFRVFGDLRVRYEGIHYPTGNDNAGAFPNFNAINTGAPFDTAGTLFSPQLNVDQNRNRARLRARLGAGIDLEQGFAAGLRLATGDTNSPVSQNQSLGAAGSGQGGNFSKYAVWLDRAFLRYEAGGLPDEDFSVSLGRFDNPFMSTNLVWADDIGFDGTVTQGRFSAGEDITPFFAAGAFPVFNTDLNFASNQPAKFKSNDKWLYAAQLGVTWDLGKDFSLKLGAAYYDFHNIEGRRSTAFVPLTSADAGDTDASRPAFAQKGNTYMALRNITPGPLNNNGTINQFQYYGLASEFKVMAFDFRMDFNHFEPFQISLNGEFAKNRGLDRAGVQTRAVNNLGSPTTAIPTGEFLGSDTAWLVGLTLGDVALKNRWTWNLNLGYRKVGSDAVVDGFNDSDFGGGGTNVQGFTLGGNLALSSRMRIGLRWLSAGQVAGPTFKNDIIQMDFNGKY